MFLVDIEGKLINGEDGLEIFALISEAHAHVHTHIRENLLQE